MARLLADENFPYPVTVDLRLLGHDVMTSDDLGRADQGLDDREVLALALREGRAVVTLNRRDFVRLHEQSSGHAGIVVCSFDIDFTGQARRIDTALADEPTLANRLLRINRPG